MPGDSAVLPRFATSPDGTRIAFDVEGAGPALVLLHGGGQTRRVWREAGYVSALTPEFTVISMDLRGSGESDKPESASAYAVSRVVEDIHAVADAAGTKRFSLWGFSYGANIGRYAATTSSRMVSMVYIGIPFGDAATGAFRETILGLVARWQPIVDQHAAGTLDPAALPEADRATWASGQVPLRLAWLKAMLDYPKVEPEDMKCPTLWLVGTLNETAMAGVGACRDRLGGTRVTLATMEGLNHPQELERIDRTLPLALEFTRSHSG